MASGLKEGDSLQLLNIQYSIFLGVILSLSFYVRADTPPTICPVMSAQHHPEAILFAVYFAFDWFTANILGRAQLRGLTPLGLSARLGWVAVLGLTVISLAGQGTWKFLLLGMYAFVSGLADLRIMAKVFGLSDDLSPRAVAGMVLGGIRAVVGLVFFIPALNGLLGRPEVLEEWDNCKSCKDALFFITGIYVTLKLIRLLFLQLSRKKMRFGAQGPRAEVAPPC